MEENHIKTKVAKALILLFAFLRPLCFSVGEDNNINQIYFSKEVLPLTFINGHPTIEAKLGDNVLRLIVDTGADAITIKLTANTIKNVKYLEMESSSLNVFGESFTDHYFKIPQLQLGNLRFTDLIASEASRSFAPMDGIIGNRFLRNFYVLIDYKEAKLVLYSKKSYPVELGLDSWEKCHFEHSNIGIVLTAKTDVFNKELKFLLDSGAYSSDNGKDLGVLILRYLENTPKNNDSVIKCNHVLIDKLDLGPTEFWIADLKEPPVDGVLGNVFFNKYKVFIDFDQSVLLMRKY